MGDKSKISNTEWGLFIGALLMVDGVQILLEWMIIGLVINPYIDIFLTMAIPFYLHMRGENMADPKRIVGLAASFFGELIPVVDEFPLWSAYGVYLFFLSRSNKILKEIPGASNVISITSGKKPEINSAQNNEQKAA